MSEYAQVSLGPSGSAAPATDNFDFVPMHAHTSDSAMLSMSDIEGDIDPAAVEQSSSKTAKPGVASKFLDSKGFGWLLEVEDGEEEEDQRPLLEELDIDVSDILYKIRCVLLPVQSCGVQRSVVRDNPDFWGPLLVVVLYAIVSLYGQFRVVSWIITIWFVGSAGVFFLARVLGGDLSFSQTLGVVGYSLLPLILTGLVLPAVVGISVLDLLIRFAGVAWAAASAASLLVTEDLRRKRLLLYYPIFLLYVYFFSLYTGA